MEQVLLESFVAIEDAHRVVSATVRPQIGADGEYDAAQVGAWAATIWLGAVIGLGVVFLAMARSFVFRLLGAGCVAAGSVLTLLFLVSINARTAAMEAHAAAQPHCAHVLDAVSEGSVRYLTEEARAAVTAVCGSRRLLVAANSPKSRIAMR